jgi:hypothetical protein
LDGWTLAWLLVLGALVALLVAPRPFPAAASVAAAVLVGWLLHGFGFWGYALAAAAAAGACVFAERLRGASRFAWKSSG